MCAPSSAHATSVQWMHDESGLCNQHARSLELEGRLQRRRMLSPPLLIGARAGSRLPAVPPQFSYAPHEARLDEVPFHVCSIILIGGAH